MMGKPARRGNIEKSVYVHGLQGLPLIYPATSEALPCLRVVCPLSLPTGTYISAEATIFYIFQASG